MRRLPELNRTRQLRAEVARLPEREFSQLTLKSEEEWRRAFVVLCFIGQSYIWGEGQKGLVDVVPKKIAVPWYHVSEHMHMYPVICYATTVLYNFYLQDPHGPWEEDNFRITNTFTGTEDEDWFYTVPLLVEFAVVPAIKVIEGLFQDMSRHRDDAVRSCLETVQQAVQAMTGALNRMFEKCNPVTFYTEIRPFQAGSKGLDAFPRGIIFEGVDPSPKQYNGASAGQSAAIHLLDVFFGVKHLGEEKLFLDTMRSHMPRGHREFLEVLAGMPSVRDYCRDSGDTDLISSFNSAVEEFVRFRNCHVIMVTRYIVNQQRYSVNPALDTKGSGGTDFMQFLKRVRDMTKELLIE